jgi:ribosomal protein L11 methylase PrmA
MNGISSRTRFHVHPSRIFGYGLYDIVCANLQSVIIENNIEKIIRCVKPGGVIIASGIGAQWKKGIRRLFVENGLDIDTEAESEGWMGYILSPRREKLLD